MMNYLDIILVPLSLFLSVGYHACLWHNFKNNPSHIIIGINTMKRREWLQGIKKGDDKKAMLAVQSLRNALMESILTGTITMLITIALGALANSAYRATSLFETTPFFGSQTFRIIVLKYGSAAVFLLASFLCSTIAVSFLVDANYLINASGEFLSFGHTKKVLERGFLMGVAGTRMLCISLPLLLWLIGPVIVLISSLAMLWVLYGLDYVTKVHGLATMKSSVDGPN
ncbi:Acetylglutamate kinase chloroplastic [Bienertia sinuspersici]